jgi:Bacterial regulatory proteins, luxR family
MVAKGYANKSIASILDISSWTVSSHLRRIYTKLGVTSRAAMVARLLDDGRGSESSPPSGSDHQLWRSSRGIDPTYDAEANRLELEMTTRRQPRQPVS